MEIPSKRQIALPDGGRLQAEQDNTIQRVEQARARADYAARYWRKIATTFPCTCHSVSHSLLGT